VTVADEVRAGLTAAVTGPGRGGGAAADRLCAGCVDLLGVDDAGLSVVSRGAFFSVGVCGLLIGEVEQLQFTLGEGPCLDAASLSAPVLTADLNGPDTQRWPMFAEAAARLGVRAVLALPVAVAGFPVGVLTLCRHRPGPLTGPALTGAFLAAELAVLPLLDVMGTDLRGAVNDVGSPAWNELGSMLRSEVYQASGVLVAQLGVPPAEAMIRLRAHAYATDTTISDVAYQILGHTLHLGDDAPGTEPEREGF
jgi:ANTAR domain/GAF domain